MKRIAGLIGFLFVLWLAALVFAPYGFRKLHFSPILFSREGKLLAARISADGQWRFPVTDSLSERYERCLTFYEDRRFHKHIGFDPLSLARAWKQ
ncbi:MAG TPA: hypothetical protein VFX48_06020, partial [Saprospiraceae bacterium]|nr:hypothetical protein [Saprospiraceae bacterium]